MSPTVPRDLRAAPPQLLPLLAAAVAAGTARTCSGWHCSGCCRCTVHGSNVTPLPVLTAGSARPSDPRKTAPHDVVLLLISLPLLPLPLLTPGAVSVCSGGVSSGTGRGTFTSSSATCATTTVMSSILPPCSAHHRRSIAVPWPGPGNEPQAMPSACSMEVWAKTGS
jgi:hypothetical protein